MDAWVERAMARWPNVPALYGWLRLDRRGRWRIRDGVITNRRIVDVINRNYAADERGCWFFQNGPQRGYVALDYAPLVLRPGEDGALIAHNGCRVESVHAAFLDEEGSLTLATEHGAGLVDDHYLEWLTGRLCCADGAELEEGLAVALSQPDGEVTDLLFDAPGGRRTAVERCDSDALPARLGFVRDPQPPGDGLSAPGVNA